jgi:hypothetical protein
MSMRRFSAITALLILLAGLPLPGSSAVTAPDAKLMEQLRQQRETQRRDIDRLMHNGSGDNDWARTTRKQLADSVASVSDERTQLAELACTASYCRLVLTHSNGTAQQDLMEKTASRPGFALPGIAHLENNGDGTAVTFVYVRHPAVQWPGLPVR